ncbi:MAG: hypothetical protein DMD91_27750 [Candidatus Rokuibacteriota bacterium]|nr:MAG: hypothetical protein DMD91_27750 [Candidatus Rokubacteria bacterium]
MAHLWERYIDAPFKHQAPRGFAEHVLDVRLEIQGKRLPDGVAYQGRPRGRGAERDRERFRTAHRISGHPLLVLTRRPRAQAGDVDAGPRTRVEATRCSSSPSRRPGPFGAERAPIRKA